jgi:hypothetical protein
MYLAKFFHRAPGDDDRELLMAFSSDSPILMGIRMNEDGDQFLREEFSGGKEGVAAFRRLAEEWRQAGYTETTHTDYTVRNLLPDPAPKPQWQRDLDDLMLSALVDNLAVQGERLAALRAPPIEREPLYLWLATHHRYYVDVKDPEAEVAPCLALAEAARDAFASRKAGKVPIYTWSIRPSEIEARIFELICRLQIEAGNVAAALAAIEQACDIATDTTRSALRAEILCECYPDRREEAFDEAFRYGSFGGYEAVLEHPDYAAYVERRKKRSKSDKGWRWAKQTQPESESNLQQAETQLGAALPKDYRAFLTTKGCCDLLIRFADDQADLRFHGADVLAQQRQNLFDYIVARESEPGEAEQYFRDEYGVSLRDLVPIAEPRHFSRCLVLHIGPGERDGWCFQWDHDGAFELEAAQPSFDAALKALTGGIERREEATLQFFGLSVE